MPTELHLARGIVVGRAHPSQEHVVLRDVELAREHERRSSRLRRDPA